MSRQYQYSIILQPELEEGGYSVSVPALPGCHTQGDTLEEAITNAREAIQCYIEGLLKDGEPIPEEKEHPQAIIISVAA